MEGASRRTPPASRLLAIQATSGALGDVRLRAKTSDVERFLEGLSLTEGDWHGRINQRRGLPGGPSRDFTRPTHEIQLLREAFAKRAGRDGRWPAESLLLWCKRCSWHVFTSSCLRPRPSLSIWWAPPRSSRSPALTWPRHTPGRGGG